MAYVHKKNHQKVISDEDYMKLLFREKLEYRYVANTVPDLGSSEKKAHIPTRPDPNSYVEEDDIPFPNPIVPNILNPDRLDKEDNI